MYHIVHETKIISFVTGLYAPFGGALIRHISRKYNPDNPADQAMAAICDPICAKYGVSLKYRFIKAMPFAHPLIEQYRDNVMAGAMAVSPRQKTLFNSPVLLRILDKDEIEALLVHEIGHMKQTDLTKDAYLFL